MCFSTKSYQIPRVCILLIGLGIFVLLFGVAHVAQADEQASTTPPRQGVIDCGGCRALQASVDATTQSLDPNLADICDICHTTNRSEDKEDANDRGNTEQSLYYALTAIIAFKTDNPYLANDFRLGEVVDDLQVAQNYLQHGEYEAAMMLIEAADKALDRLRIEAQRTNFINGESLPQTSLVAVSQTETKTRSMNEILLSGQHRLLLDIENQEFILAFKRQVVFTVRTEHVLLHRRVPLSDEEANVLFHFVRFRQRSPFTYARSLFFYWQAESQWLRMLKSPIRLQSFAYSGCGRPPVSANGFVSR